MIPQPTPFAGSRSTPSEEVPAASGLRPRALSGLSDGQLSDGQLSNGLLSDGLLSDGPHSGPPNSGSTERRSESSHLSRGVDSRGVDSRGVDSRGESIGRNEWPVGRLLELASSDAASARTTTAIDQVARRQREGELVAWIQVRGGTFYPPDAAESGVDLAALTVVHVPSSALEAARAAELLLRSGAFGLVIVDLEGMVDASLPSRALARLHALCRQHGSTVAFLTPPAREALGSLVSLRLEPRRSELRAPLELALPLAPETSEEAVRAHLATKRERDTEDVRVEDVRVEDVRVEDVRVEDVRVEETLHAITPEILRDKLGHVPVSSLHRGPVGLTRHDELTPTRRGVVVPFPARASTRTRRDEATLPLPFFEACGA